MQPVDARGIATTTGAATRDLSHARERLIRMATGTGAEDISVTVVLLASMCVGRFRLLLNVTYID